MLGVTSSRGYLAVCVGCVCARVCMRVHVWRVPVHVCACVCACVHVCARVCARMRVCVCTHVNKLRMT